MNHYVPMVFDARTRTIRAVLTRDDIGAHWQAIGADARWETLGRNIRERAFWSGYYWKCSHCGRPEFE